MRCCALIRAPALRLLQISGGGIRVGHREVTEVATGVGVEAGFRVVTLSWRCAEEAWRSPSEVNERRKWRHHARTVHFCGIRFVTYQFKLLGIVIFNFW
jgi:hypothetical protein